jgi:hypothetical protein
MVDYEHGEGEPQHAVLSWLGDEAKGLPEVGTYLVRAADSYADHQDLHSRVALQRMLLEIQHERDELRLRAVRAEQSTAPSTGGPERPTDEKGTPLCFVCRKPQSEHSDGVECTGGPELRNRLRTILSRLTLTDDEWLAIDNAIDWSTGGPEREAAIAAFEAIMGAESGAETSR